MKAEEAKLFCLTSGQRWLLHLFEQSRQMARPVQRIYRLSSSFDPSAFLEALEYIVASHPALRLRLVQKKSGWKQVFPEQDPVISGEEILGRTPEMRAAYITMLLADEARSAMDLRKESPVKAKLIKADGEFLLSLCVDHIAADEIAFDLLEQALLCTYTEVMNRMPLSLSPSDDLFQYLSKEMALQDSEHPNLLYWQQQLKDAPMRGQSNDEINWAPATVFEYTLNGTLYQSIQDFCRTNRCSLFNLMIAVQLLIMAETANQDDLVLNIPISNRARANEKNIIANLSMLLHVRFTEIRRDPASRLVSYVRDKVLTAMAHRQYDYPSLSHFIAGEAEQKGVSTGWLLGCSFVMEQTAAVFPNELFEERLDNQFGRVYDIPATSFSAVFRQTAPVLKILIDWDEACWPVPADAMENRFLHALQTLSRTH